MKPPSIRDCCRCRCSRYEVVWRYWSVPRRFEELTQEAAAIILPTACLKPWEFWIHFGVFFSVSTLFRSDYHPPLYLILYF